MIDGKLALVLALTACGTDKAASQTENKPGSGSAPVAPPITGLVIDHVTLLQPEDVFGARAPDTKKVAATIKDVEAAIRTYDAVHAGALPAGFDLILVVRPTAMRAWLVDEKGDVAAPELEATIAKLPRFDVTERNVGIILTIGLAGTKTPHHDPWLPSSWKAAGGGYIDDTIDKVWR